MAFGFMPRIYSSTADDRYILEEEGDVTEISFVVSGEWAIAFNTYMVLEDTEKLLAGSVEHETPIDMIKQGHYIA